MIVNLKDYNLENFEVKEGEFCGLPARLITPQRISVKFTQANKIFRSSVWSLSGDLLSGGLKKFVNFGENAENFPVPFSVDECFFVEKIDGSLVCLDFVNGQLSMRTRGTLSYKRMDNASDFDYCLAKYPKITEWLKGHPNYTLLCEITTPNLRIILDYGAEPDFWLIGAVNKNYYSLMTQRELGMLGTTLGLKRPALFSFASISELMDKVAGWEDKEGVCLYSNDSQEIHKIKARTYLKLHRFKSNATFENTLDLFFEYGKPSYQEFERQLREQFDFECWNMVRGFASMIVDGYKEAEEGIRCFQVFVERILKPMSSRKLQAEAIFNFYGRGDLRSSLVFSILDGKTLTDKQLKESLRQIIGKV